VEVEEVEPANRDTQSTRSGSANILVEHRAVAEEYLYNVNRSG
jgi:hypothetical protein